MIKMFIFHIFCLWYCSCHVGISAKRYATPDCVRILNDASKRSRWDVNVEEKKATLSATKSSLAWRRSNATKSAFQTKKNSNRFALFFAIMISILSRNRNFSFLILDDLVSVGIQDIGSLVFGSKRRRRIARRRKKPWDNSRRSWKNSSGRCAAVGNVNHVDSRPTRRIPPFFIDTECSLSDRHSLYCWRSSSTTCSTNEQQTLGCSEFCWIMPKILDYYCCNWYTERHVCLKYFKTAILTLVIPSNDLSIHRHHFTFLWRLIYLLEGYLTKMGKSGFSCVWGV